MGFLGAGTIIRSKASVKGLTTAASLWTAGAIGLAIGSGFHKAAFVATVIVLVTLVFFARIGKKLYDKGWFKKCSSDEEDGEEEP